VKNDVAPARSRPWWRLTLVGYAIAALCVGIIVLVKENALSERALDATPLLLAAIGVTTWFGGVGPGLVATLLATFVVDYYFIEPIYTWTVAPKDVPTLIMFALSALFFVWVGVARRTAEQELRKARDEMESAVVRRTAELARANEQLRGEILERKRTEKALEELAGRLISAQEDERSRIGRELHDHISQRLGILAIKLDQLRMKSATNGIAPALDDLREETREITSELHGLSHRLHSSMLDHLGVVPAVQRLVNECSQRYDIPIAFTHASMPAGRVPSDVSLCLFRIVEESLTNIAKHSRAPSARVDMKTEAGGLRLTIADDGVGFDPSTLETRAGLGFVSMRERLRLVHGTMKVQSAPAQGTRIEVWVPPNRLAS
jgi:signal transduction histidine kinase